VTLQFGFLGILFLEPKASILSSASILSIVATFIYIIATVILFFAFLALRPSLRVSPIPKNGAPLITSGIYKYFRHPMYLAVLLFGAGLTLNNLNVISILIWFMLLVTLIIKANFEDSLLLERHPNADLYQKTVIGMFRGKNA
jgi:protein-S-isoprenylcysteine O-methyltransferase Ste14